MPKHGSEPSGLFDFAIAAFEYVALRITVLCPILLCQMGSADGFSVSRAGEGSIGRTLLRHTSYCAFLMTLDLQFGLNLCKRFNFSGNSRGFGFVYFKNIEVKLFNILNEF